MIEPEPLMTIEQVAKWLYCSPDSVRKYVETEDLPFIRLSKGSRLTLRFSRDAVQRWIDRRSGHIERAPAGFTPPRLWGWDGVSRLPKRKGRPDSA